MQYDASERPSVDTMSKRLQGEALLHRTHQMCYLQITLVMTRVTRSLICETFLFSVDRIQPQPAGEIRISLQSNIVASSNDHSSPPNL